MPGSDNDIRLIILIAAHKNELQLLHLIKVLRHPKVTIYLHLDKKSAIDPSAIPPDVKLVRERVVVTWQQYSQVQAIVNSLKQIVASEKVFSYVAYISGQDYPVVPVDKMLNDLAARNGTEFLHHVPLDRTGWYNARVRFERFYFDSYSSPVTRWFGARLTFICDKFRLKRRFYRGFEPWGGSSWWTLTRSCILYLIDFLENNRSLINYMKKTIFADEMIFHAIIMNSCFAGRTVSDNLRYIEFIKGNPNPNILTSCDYDKIISGHCHFARKFDTGVDETILDMLDQHRASTLPG